MQLPEFHVDSHAASAAAILASRRAHGMAGPRLPESRRPAGIDAALAIQAAVTSLLGERVAGWKCGMPSEGRVVLAPIHAATVHAGASCPVWTRNGQARIEPELAFILGRDLPARAQPYAPQEIDAAIAGTRLALELIGTRYEDPDAAGFMEHLADGLFNQGLFLGPPVDGVCARSAGAVQIALTSGSAPERRFDGRHPNGDPRAPLYWLAEFLRARGQGLQAGQAIITGSYAGSIDVPAGQDLSVRYEGLGELSVRWVEY